MRCCKRQALLGCAPPATKTAQANVCCHCKKKAFYTLLFFFFLLRYTLRTSRLGLAGLQPPLTRLHSTRPVGVTSLPAPGSTQYRANESNGGHPPSKVKSSVPSQLGNVALRFLVRLDGAANGKVQEDLFRAAWQAQRNQRRKRAQHAHVHDPYTPIPIVKTKESDSVGERQVRMRWRLAS